MPHSSTFHNPTSKAPFAPTESRSLPHPSSHPSSSTSKKLALLSPTTTKKPALPSPATTKKPAVPSPASTKKPAVPSSTTTKKPTVPSPTTTKPSALPSATTTKNPPPSSQTPTPPTSLIIVYIYSFNFHHSPPPSFSLPMIHELRYSDPSIYDTDSGERGRLFDSILREQLKTRRFRRSGAPIKSDVVVLVGSRRPDREGDRLFDLVDGMRRFGVVPKWGNGVEGLVTGQVWADCEKEMFWCPCGRCQRCKTGKTASEWECLKEHGLSSGPVKSSWRDPGQVPSCIVM